MRTSPSTAGASGPRRLSNEAFPSIIGSPYRSLPRRFRARKAIHLAQIHKGMALLRGQNPRGTHKIGGRADAQVRHSMVRSRESVPPDVVEQADRSLSIGPFG